MASTEAPTGIQLGEDRAVLDSVSKYYGQELQSTADLKTGACLTFKAPPPEVKKVLARVPAEVLDRYYGCGSPLPLGITGLRVLDLGSGSGRDCYAAAALVGESGSVTGVDMTEEQLAVARRHVDEYCTQTLGYKKPNMRFVKGEIERLDAAGVAEGSADLIISNCVVNLSPDKEAVLRQAWRALAPGGEVHFSDVYADRRLPAEARRHPLLVGECLGGVLYVQDFERLARRVGFADPRQLSVTEIKTDALLSCPAVDELRALLGGATFYSITYRLFKLPGRLEEGAEDYGQAVRYKGTIPDSPLAYALDQGRSLQAGKWYEADGNTAAILGESWLAPHFEVAGDRHMHYGRFRAGGTAVDAGAGPAADTAQAAGATGCCAPPAPKAAAGSASAKGCGC